MVKLLQQKGEDAIQNISERVEGDLHGTAIEDLLRDVPLQA